MSYQVLARKWRPQDFDSVVGQAPVVRALQNALSDGRIAQAYLFSGIRGVGKTSVARILAKALNCENGPAANPCNDCATCREITGGSDFDVIEHDAATYSKVEQVRELNESLKYGPARDRYKVVILDEIHRLSRQAFDALLKIVEEPPDHLVFIFATTEADAVPATLLSRCQDFRFRRVALDELAEHLAFLAGSEEIAVGPAALRIIARAGDGSVRDSVALLDQLATFGSGSIEDDDAARLLGGLDPEIFHGVLEAIAKGDGAHLSEVVSRIETEGWDPRFVFSEFLAYCRMALRLALGTDTSQLETTGEAAEALRKLAQGVGYENLLRAIYLLLQSEESVRRSESASLALEIAWLRAAELPRLVAIEELLSGGSGPLLEADPAAKSPGSGEGSKMRAAAAPRPARKARPAPPPGASEPAEPAGLSKPAKPAEPAEPAKPTKRAQETEEAEPPRAAESTTDRGPELASDRAAPAADTPPPLGEEAAVAAPASAPASAKTDGAPGSASGPADEGNGFGANVEGFVARVSKERQALAAHLSGARSLAFRDGTLEIAVEAGDTWLRDRLARTSNKKILEAALAATWGAGSAWRLIDAPAAGTPEASEGGAGGVQTGFQDAQPPRVDDPRVQAVLDIFGGSIESVEPTETD